MLNEIYLLIAGGIGAGIASFFQFLVSLVNKDKTDAEASKVKTDADIDERKSYVENIISLTHAVTGLTREVSNLTMQTNQKEERMGRMEIGLKEKTSQIEALQDDNRRKAGEIEELSATVNDLRAAKLTTSKKVEQLEGSILSLQSELREKQRQITALETKVNEQRTHIDKLEREKLQLQKEMAALQGEKTSTQEFLSVEAGTDNHVGALTSAGLKMELLKENPDGREE